MPMFELKLTKEDRPVKAVILSKGQDKRTVKIINRVKQTLLIPRLSINKVTEQRNLNDEKLPNNYGKHNKLKVLLSDQVRIQRQSRHFKLALGQYHPNRLPS